MDQSRHRRVSTRQPDQPGSTVTVHQRIQRVGAVGRCGGLGPSEDGDNVDTLDINESNPQPLVDGQVDAMAVFVTSQPITLDRRGVANVAVTFNDLGFPSYENVLIAQRNTVENDRDILARYLRANIKGWEFNRRDLAAGAKKTFDLYGKESSLDLTQQTEENKRQMPLMESSLTDEKGLFQMSLEDIAGPQYEALRRAGVEPLPDVKSFVTLDVLDAAYQGKTSLLE